MGFHGDIIVFDEELLNYFFFEACFLLFKRLGLPNVSLLDQDALGHAGRSRLGKPFTAQERGGATRAVVYDVCGDGFNLVEMFSIFGLTEWPQV